MTRDGDAANDNDAAPLLDLVENPAEIGVERRVAAMLGPDLSKPEPLFMEGVEQLLESRGVPSSQVEGDVVLPEIDAAPGHALIGQAEGHDILRAGRMLAPFPIPRNCRGTRIRPLRDIDRGLTIRRSTMTAVENPSAELTPEQLRDLRRLAGFMVPASAEYGVPGADDEAILADIVRSLGSDKDDVREALAILREIAGGDFAGLDEASAEAAAMTLLGREHPVIAALGRAVLQCYYRDDRVMHALGIEPRAPYPQGRVLEPGDWSLLDPVRGRPRMWRDVDGTET
jgi:hypothetical protein